MVMRRSRGSFKRPLSAWASLWKGIIIDLDRNFHSGLGSLPLAKSSTNVLSRSAVFGRLPMSLKSSHVLPSLFGADFLGMPVKAFVTALIGTEKNAVLNDDGGIRT